ncbi:MAG: hypothetical protein EBX39_13755, partial [Actinobacteria bacterium]|nr:hypothetical protein [Actinomycetota bacterium]
MAADASSPYATDLGYDQADAGYWTTSFNASVDRSGVTNPVSEEAYKTIRYGYNLAYAFNGLTAGGVYRVRLHFVEDNYTSSDQRRMDVAFNGVTAQTGLDIYAEAGARYKALAKDYTVTADSAGKILASLTATRDNASLSAIEVFSGSTRVASADCGGPTPGTITVEPATFVNQGSLRAAASSSLVVSGQWTNAATGSIRSRPPLWEPSTAPAALSISPEPSTTPPRSSPSTTRPVPGSSKAAPSPAAATRHRDLPSFSLPGGVARSTESRSPATSTSRPDRSPSAAASRSITRKSASATAAAAPLAPSPSTAAPRRSPAPASSSSGRTDTTASSPAALETTAMPRPRPSPSARASPSAATPDRSAA